MSEQRQVYVITEGSYSDYCIGAIVTGPRGASLATLWRKFKVDTVYPGKYQDGWVEWIDCMRDRYGLHGYREGAIFARWLQQQPGEWKIVAYNGINIED